MTQSQTKKITTKQLVLGAILTALVIVLQLWGSFIRFGPFSVSLVLIPIVIGAATCGKGIGAWLGFVFGIAVLSSGDAGTFLAVDVFGTIVTVLVKGTLSGFLAGVMYDILQKYNKFLAIMTAAIVCPVVNTGVFLLGCLLFFMETVAGWCQQAGLGTNVAKYMIVGLVGINFVFELAVNIILAPLALRIINIRNKN